MRPVVVAGVGMIPFERRDDDSLMDMLATAGLNAMDDAGLGIVQLTLSMLATWPRACLTTRFP